MFIQDLQSAYLRLAKADLSPTALRTLLLMLAKATEEGLVQMSKQDLAGELEVDERTVFSAIKQLLESRFVSEVVSTPGQTNWYKLHQKIVDTCIAIAGPANQGGAATETQYAVVVTGKEAPKAWMAGQGTQDHLIQTQDHSIQTQDHLIRRTQDHLIQTQDLLIRDGEGGTSLLSIYNNNIQDLSKEDPTTNSNQVRDYGSPQAAPPTEDWMDQQAARLKQRFADRQRSLILCEGYKAQYMSNLLDLVARIHKQTPALEADISMRSSNDAFTAIVVKMQEITVALWQMGVRSEEELDRLGKSWYKDHFSGKQGNPPQGNQFVQFCASAIHTKNTKQAATPKSSPQENVVVPRRTFNAFNRPNTAQD